MLTRQKHRAKLAVMKRKKAPVKKVSVGTVVGAKYRARCNELLGSEREKLNDEFLKRHLAFEDMSEAMADTWEKLGPTPRVNYDAVR